MLWFKQNQKTPAKEIHVPALHFIGEHVGPPEQTLTERMIEFFKRDQSVQRAYLTKVNFGDGSPTSVALCLRTQYGMDNGMIEKLRTIFASVFNAREHLDIIFLTDQQEHSLAMVCKPFFDGLS